MEKVTKAHIAVLLTNLFFAANYSLIKLLSPALLGPFAMNVVRVAVSLAFFWVFWLFGNTAAGFRREDAGRFVLCALTGVAVNQMLFIKGLTLTSTIHASLLILVTPIVVTLFAFWVLKESFTIYKGLGLLLGISGAVFLVMQKETGSHADSYLLGDMLIVINAVSYSVYFILVKPLMNRYSPLHVIRWVFTIGLFMLLPFGWHETMEIHWGALQAKHYLALLMVTVGGTFLAYLFNVYGIRQLGAGVTGSYIYTQPVFAVLIAVLFVGEQMDWKKILAGAFIFSGVYLVNYSRKRE